MTHKTIKELEKAEYRKNIIQQERNRVLGLIDEIFEKAPKQHQRWLANPLEELKARMEG